MESPVLAGAAAQFTAAQLGGPTSEKETVVATGATPVTACGNDPDRVGLVIINLGANTVYAALAGNPSASLGIILNSNGGSLTLNVRDDYSLSTREWSVSSPAGASSVYVLELRRYTKLQS